MDVTPLFRPFKLGQLDLRNRIVMAPMTRKLSPDGVPGEDVSQYYRRRAEGGVGLIITEGTTIGRPAASGSSSIPNFHSPDSLVGWAKVVREVHAAGSRIAPQLWHLGNLRAKGTGPSPETPSEGPSETGSGARAMTDADIADSIAAFATAATAARQIGFDAVELHGAHGYLLDQFLWAHTNGRADAYGGDAARRTRFAADVVRAVRQAVGPDFPIILRFSQWKLQDYAATLAGDAVELEQVLGPLSDAGVDIFHASTRRFWEPAFTGSSLNLAGWTRKITGRPTISVGSVGLSGADFLEQLLGESNGAPLGTLEDLLRRMEEEEFDLIAIGRALISNPNWPNAIRRGDFQALFPFEKSHLASLA
ncbi:NADH:flavin oxidoreductase (plasmid) [Rhizobium leguminosarum bv. trifolii]|nr:NADH:flavin oxidoreductase [Rhizobium leguminosarum bv. trifolii]